MNREEQESYEMQEALQRQQLDAQQAQIAPQLQEQVQQNQSVLIDQTNPRKIVKEIILRLKGEVELPDGRVEKVAEAKMNQVGIDNAWFILDSHINQGTILSHITNKEVGNIIDEIQNDIVNDLTLNWQHYGIKRKTDLDLINNSILVNIFLALKRSQEQNEKNWLGRVSIESISNNQSQLAKQKSGGWRDRLRV